MQSSLCRRATLTFWCCTETVLNNHKHEVKWPPLVPPPEALHCKTSLSDYFSMSKLNLIKHICCTTRRLSTHASEDVSVLRPQKLYLGRYGFCQARGALPCFCQAHCLIPRPLHCLSCISSRRAIPPTIGVSQVRSQNSARLGGSQFCSQLPDWESLWRDFWVTFLKFSSGASGGSLNKGARFKVEKAFLLHEKGPGEPRRWSKTAPPSVPPSEALSEVEGASRGIFQKGPWTS